MVAHEICHYLKSKSRGRRGVAALKLDMSKAYDRVEWPFLSFMMKKLGFDEAWISLVLSCVISVKYSLNINGSLSPKFTPSRGLRQGDPLSPYLFLICAKGLSGLLHQGEQQGWLHGCRVARGAPVISHLLFADNSLLFFTASKSEGHRLKEWLSIF